MVAADGKPYSLGYDVLSGGGFSTSWATVGNIGVYPRTRTVLRLRHGTDDHWSISDSSGKKSRLDELRGCVDVDIGFTPSTNTLPIRRLCLEIGQSADVDAAWVRFPELTVERLRQRYTRLADDRYRYESVDSGFTAELQVDTDGLVVMYEGLWERVGETSG